MTQLLSSRGVDISQRNFQQVIIRGDGKDQFNQIINQEISVLPPSKNLEVTINDKFMFAKNNELIYSCELGFKWNFLSIKNQLVDLPFTLLIGFEHKIITCKIKYSRA